MELPLSLYCHSFKIKRAAAYSVPKTEELSKASKILIDCLFMNSVHSILHYLQAILLES